MGMGFLSLSVWVRILPRTFFVATKSDNRFVRDFVYATLNLSEFSTLYLKASSFLLHQEVMNGYRFQEELQGKQRINQ